MVKTIPKLEITGLYVEHKNGNGIHTYCPNAWVHHNKVVGGQGGSICFEGVPGVQTSNCIAEYNELIDPATVYTGSWLSLFGIYFYNVTNCIARFNTVNGHGCFLRFEKSTDCTSYRNTFSKHSPNIGIKAIDFQSTATRCKSIGDTFEGKPISVPNDADPGICEGCEVKEEKLPVVPVGLIAGIMAAGAVLLLLIYKLKKK
jgi:hypothetical protein